MAEVTREAVNPTLIPNTSMNKVFIDGVHKLYEITASAGYVLHDNRDDLEPDGITMPEVTEMFGSGTISVKNDYDFTNKMKSTYNGADITKYGAYELYTISGDLVSSNNIYGRAEMSIARTEAEKSE